MTRQPTMSGPEELREARETLIDWIAMNRPLVNCGTGSLIDIKRALDWAADRIEHLEYHDRHMEKQADACDICEGVFA